MADIQNTFNRNDQSSPGHYGPSQTALLIMDFHQFIVARAGSVSESAVKVASQLRRWALSQGILVIHALIDVDGTPFPMHKNHERIAALVDNVKTNGEYEEPEELTAGVTDSAKEVSFKRTPGHVSALESQGLCEYLVAENITSLVLCGLSTSGCTLRTAGAANEARYVVTVISDGCADRQQDVHDILTNKVLPMTAHVMTAEEFQKEFAICQSSA